MNRKAALAPGSYLVIPIIILAKFIEEFYAILLAQIPHSIFRKTCKKQIANLEFHFTCLLILGLHRSLRRTGTHFPKQNLRLCTPPSAHPDGYPAHTG